MKTKTIVAISIFILAVFIISGSCATRKKTVSETEFFEEYSGTWINKDNNGSTFQPQKMVHFPDGSWEYYSLLTVEQLYARGKDKMLDMWTDSNGDFWYKTRWEEYIYKQEGFTLRKISDSGNTHEMLLHLWGESIDEWDPDNIQYKYVIYYRQ
jgi:hypothetical protein